jgi:hypothetical protein
MMKNNLTAANQMPDLTGSIYVDGLLQVSPGSVSIVK